MVVFLALSMFTAISFLVNYFVGRNMTGLAIILGVAVVKAILVGLYFMHLVVDWFKLYYLIFPTFILAAMFITVLLPDIVLAWHH
jgi:cytochrome c oxidase subunit IV